MYIKNPSVLEKIQAAMNLLYDLIEEIDNYLDKSLFFQDPRVIEGWLLLAGEIKKIEIEDAPESAEDWDSRPEPFAASLIARRDLFLKYKNLYQKYYHPLYNLWMNCDLDGVCISADAQETLKAEHYEKILNVEDFDQYLEDVNSRSGDARYFVYKIISYIHDILRAIMDKAGQVVIDLKPSDEDFAKAIDDDLREWTLQYGDGIFEDMIEELGRNYKEYLTDDEKPELWGEMLRADEDALKMAMKQQLSQCNDYKQDHWGEDMKAQMDENGELMRNLFSPLRAKKLLDLSNTDIVKPFIEWLTSENLEMFYEIIVRRNLIQCEMFPELKVQHDEWLRKDAEKKEYGEYTLADGNSISTESSTNLNYYAPTISLQSLLKQDWFKEVRTNEMYNGKWTDKFISDLMASQWKDDIARDWAVAGERGKKNEIKGYILGLLKDNGVIKGSFDKIADKVGIMKGTRSFSNYMSQGKKQPYSDWVKSYVTGLTEE